MNLKVLQAYTLKSYVNLKIIILKNSKKAFSFTGA